MKRADATKVCGRCGHVWISHTENPVRCPGCGTYRWHGEQRANKCAVCGHRWFSRSDGVPLRCPACKTRSWNGGKKAVPGSSAKVDDKVSRCIIDLYLGGMGCLGIARSTGVALSTVIAIVRTEVCDPRDPRI